MSMQARWSALRRFSRRRPRLAAALVGLTLVALLAARIIFAGMALRAEAIDDWKQDLSNLSLLLAENTAQNMTAARLVLDAVSADIQAGDRKSVV